MVRSRSHSSGIQTTGSGRLPIPRAVTQWPQYPIRPLLPTTRAHIHTLISPPSHPNRTHTVRVAAGQSWVTIPREQLTTLDKLLVWMSQADQPLGSPISVNLETRGSVLGEGRGCPKGGDGVVEVSPPLTPTSRHPQ